MAVQNSNGEILKEIKELKALINDVKTKQGAMEKALLKINKRLDLKDFDLAKSTHAVSAFLLKYCFTVTCNKYKFCLNVYICIYMNFILFQANVTKICAKAYIQLGRFTKANASKAVSTTQ